ncbi:MAG: YHYH protein [Alphaproteobacteria bacterium]|nr:YHYH protein [Alphaproteobacteria bacterium]
MRTTGWWLVVLAGCEGGLLVDLGPDDTGDGVTDTTDTTDTTGGTDTDDPQGAGDCAQAATLLDLSGAAGAGEGYAAAEVSGHCTADAFVIQSNQMPHYTFVQTTPNALAPADLTVSIPLHPARAASTTAIPLLGLAAVSVSGTPIYGPNEAAMPPAQAWGDPVYNGIMDPCLGHTAFTYHQHALSQRCLVQASVGSATPWTLPAPDANTPSPVLGWSLDGFAIYGRYECVDAACSSVVEVTSSYTRTGDPTRDAWDAYTYTAGTGAMALDACNGHVGPDGDYHYHATLGFPYVLGCYAGTPSDDVGGDGPAGGRP